MLATFGNEFKEIGRVKKESALLTGRNTSSEKGKAINFRSSTSPYATVAT